jgi:hypothetical protein
VAKSNGRYWKGELNGITGIFPSEYVKEAAEEEVTISDLVACMTRGDLTALEGYIASLPQVLTIDFLNK